MLAKAAKWLGMDSDKLMRLPRWRRQLWINVALQSMAGEAEGGSKGGPEPELP